MEFSESMRTNKDFPTSDMFKFMRKAGCTAHDVAVAGHSLLDMNRLVAGDYEHAPPNIPFRVSLLTRRSRMCM
jgi:hypothetical protein